MKDKDKLSKLRNIALNKTWVSFVNQDNHPFSLLHWSVGGVHHEPKDVWLLQDEMSFHTQEFLTIEEAIGYIEGQMEEILEILG